MKKILVILVVLFLVSSCGDKTQQETTKTLKDTNQQVSSEKKVDTLLIQQKLFSDNLKQLEKQKPELVKDYKKYSEKMGDISKKLNISYEDTEVLVFKISPYLLKYKALEKEVESQPENKDLKKKLDDYKDFINLNLEKNSINKSVEDLNDIVKAEDVRSLFSTKKKINKYLLPDGTMVDESLKQLYEDTKEQMGDVDEQLAVEEFKKVVIAEQAMMEGNCDTIENELERLSCESINKN